MSQQFQLQPENLRSAAEMIRTNAERIESSIRAIDQSLNALPSEFIGTSAQSLLQRYQHQRDEMMSWQARLIKFADQLVQIAADFQQADAVQQTSAVMIPPLTSRWVERTDQKDTWRRLLEESEKELDRLLLLQRLVFPLPIWNDAVARQQALVEQVHTKLAVDLLDDIRELRPEIWITLSAADRTSALVHAHNVYAEAYGFPPTQVNIIDLPERINGQLHGALFDKRVYIDTSLLGASDPSPVVNTLLHESRHMFQLHAMYNRAAFNYIPDHSASDWFINSYFTYNTGSTDWNAYRTQAIENDAWKAGDYFEDQLYDNT